MGYEIKKDYIKSGTKRRSGVKNLGVKFIVSHDTGNPDSTAKQNVTYYKNSANEMSASAHTFIDSDSIIECVPLTEKAWHVLYDRPLDNKLFGDDSNDIAIGVELCYSPKGKFDSKEAYKRYVWYLAKLCKDYKLDPRTKIIGHEQLDPGRKTDPTNALKTIGKCFKDLITDVYEEYLNQTGTKPVIAAAVQASVPKPVKAKVKKLSDKLPTGLLRKGNKGASVKALQEALNGAYFYVDKTATNKGVDSDFGTKTELAVKRFQMVHLSNDVDGVYGPATRKKLQEVLRKNGK